MNNPDTELLEYMRTDLNNGLHDFGHYNFWDKGAVEVCWLPLEQLKKLTPEIAAATLEAFSKESKESKRYVEDTVVGLDDWNELFDEKAPWSKFIFDHY